MIHPRSSWTHFQLPIIAFNYIQASLVLSSRSIPVAPFRFWPHFFDFASTHSILVIPTRSGLYPLIMNSIHLTSTVHIQTQPSYHSYQPPKSPPTTCDVLSCFHSISPVSRSICLILLSSSLHRRVVHDAPRVYEFWLSCCGEIQVLLWSRGRLCVEDKETISQEPLVIFP